MACATRAATPSTPPSCWAVLTRPDARPDSLSSAPLVAPTMLETQTAPSPTPTTSDGSSRAATYEPPGSSCDSHASPGGEKRQAAGERGPVADPRDEPRGERAAEAIVVASRSCASPDSTALVAGRLLCLSFSSSSCGRTLACGQSAPGPDSLLARGPAAARSARASCSHPADAPGSGRSARDACSAGGAALGPARYSRSVRYRTYDRDRPSRRAASPWDSSPALTASRISDSVTTRRSRPGDKLASPPAGVSRAWAGSRCGAWRGRRSVARRARPRSAPPA
jgi:hypothetical protein